MPCSAASNTVNQQTYSCYVSADALKAEIMLAMKFVFPRYSKESMDDFPNLLKMKYPDSKTVSEISLKPTKINYIINQLRHETILQ